MLNASLGPRSLLASALVALAIAFGAVGAPASAQTIQDLPQTTEPLHVRVLWEQNPAHEAVVSWTTVAPGVVHTVYFDTEPRGGDLSAYRHRVVSSHSGPYTLRNDEGGMAAYFHNGVLRGLSPSTTYYLTVESGGRTSGEYHFVTAPADDRPISVLVGGDSRIGDDHRWRDENDRRGMNARMAALLEENPEIIALVHTADYTNRAYWSQLYWWLKDHHEMTTTAAGRLLPIIPSRGNHDLDVGFEEMFWWPNRENDFYYTSHLNSDVSLVVLNTEISRAGDQRVWLERELWRLRPQKRWLWAAYHRPAYPSVRDFSSGEPQRRSWVPLFEEHRIDFVASGHDHAMKRTAPILGGQVVGPDEGIVYVGDGGLGVSQRTPDESRWYFQEGGVTMSAHHVQMITFTEDEVRIRTIGMDGDLLDDARLQPRPMWRPVGAGATR